MFGFLLLLMSIFYTNPLESGDKSNQKPPSNVVLKNRTFSLGFTFEPKSPFLSEVLVVLALKIGGRVPKGMCFQIEKHRCGLELRPGTFREEIGQCLL